MFGSFGSYGYLVVLPLNEEWFNLKYSPQTDVLGSPDFLDK